MAIITGNTILASDVVNNIIYSGVDSSGSDAYAISPTPALISYVTGQTFVFKAGTANTGSSSINVSGLGAKTIKKNVSVDTATGDILVGQIVTVIYDGTNMQMVSPAPATYSNGITTKNASDASTAQTIAHGLGKIPKKIRLAAMGLNGATQQVISTSIGAYDGTNNSRILNIQSDSTGINAVVSGSTADAIAIGAGFSDPGTIGQTGVVTVDATNITITWTKHGSPSANTFEILWEAEG